MELLLPSIGLLFWTLVTFIIVFLVLKKFAWKPILQSLKDRETGIAESLATADRVRGEMAQLKSENEELLAKAREERALMIKEAKETSDRMIEDAREKAKLEFDRIVSDAQATIDQQRMAALTDVKNQVGLMVIEVAEKVLRRELNNKTEQENFIKQLADSTLGQMAN